MLSINYWNLKLAIFEPCLEPWRFKISQVVNKRDEIIGSNMKVSSDILGWNKDKYINDLNLNVSTSLFHTIKEIQIKYEQEEIDEEEICLNLTLSSKSNYLSLFNNSRKLILSDGSNRLDKFPQQLKTFFGREFVLEGDIKNKKNHEIFDK